MRQLRIGDTVPLSYTRATFTREIAPTWFVLVSGRLRRDMLAAAAWLVRQGAPEAWFPEETRRRQFRRGNRMFREAIEVPIVPGIVFLLADRQPQWDILAGRRIRPMLIGDRPAAVSEAVLAEMRVVPRRIAELKDAAERARREAAMAKIPRPGDEAEIMVGPFAGRVVRVGEVEGGEAVVLLDGLRLRAGLGALERRA